ncbi:hypothetical protein CBOM_07423 [Ceraceosorus bombacis]|uniref:Uncharacterized protein n=1 Tax=Ceraceosorus bombacis TaxID=401625 RepID=A0A0P1BD50_9BASI|nr:hypothetical protein CBOM_07423 [Ceraceosorus bombacis]
MGLPLTLIPWSGVTTASKATAGHIHSLRFGVHRLRTACFFSQHAPRFRHANSLASRQPCQHPRRILRYLILIAVKTDLCTHRNTHLSLTHAVIVPDLLRPDHDDLRSHSIATPPLSHSRIGSVAANSVRRSWCFSSELSNGRPNRRALRQGQCSARGGQAISSSSMGLSALKRRRHPSLA